MPCSWSGPSTLLSESGARTLSMTSQRVTWGEVLGHRKLRGVIRRLGDRAARLKPSASDSAQRRNEARSEGSVAVLSDECEPVSV